MVIFKMWNMKQKESYLYSLCLDSNVIPWCQTYELNFCLGFPHIVTLSRKVIKIVAVSKKDVETYESTANFQHGIQNSKYTVGGHF